jgi:hypothetical protein
MVILAEESFLTPLLGMISRMADLVIIRVPHLGIKALGVVLV